MGKHFTFQAVFLASAVKHGGNPATFLTFSKLKVPVVKFKINMNKILTEKAYHILFYNI